MTKARNKCLIILIDIDGVLCQGEHWTVKNCLTAEPIIKNINKVNKL